MKNAPHQPTKLRRPGRRLLCRLHSLQLQVHPGIPVCNYIAAPSMQCVDLQGCRIAGISSRIPRAFRASSQRANPLTCRRAGSHLDHLGLHGSLGLAPIDHVASCFPEHVVKHGKQPCHKCLRNNPGNTLPLTLWRGAGACTVGAQICRKACCSMHRVAQHQNAAFPR
jgi:hypothetical protein